MPVKFQFRWIPFVAVLIAAAIGISLGNWQTRRAVEKEEIEAKLTARETAPPVLLSPLKQQIDEIEYKRVIAKGEFLPKWTVYLDNRPYKGAAGFYVLTPFRLEGSSTYVLVVRGWVKRDFAERTRLPVIPVPAGPVEITGIARRNPGQVLQLGTAEKLTPGAIVQNTSPEEFSRATGLSMQPFIIEQLTDTNDALVRDWPRPSTGAEKHRGYAFQWYALAAMAIIFFVVTGLKRGR